MIRIITEAQCTNNSMREGPFAAEKYKETHRGQKLH